MADFDIEDAYRVYFPLIREKCSRMLRDPATAQDIAQETFIRFWKNRDAIGETRSIPAWLYRTSTRMAIDSLRERKRRTSVSESELPLAADESPAGDRFDAARELQRLAEIAPKKELEAAILSRLDGLSHREIASVLGTSERTVRRRLRSFDARLERHVESSESGESGESGESLGGTK